MPVAIEAGMGLDLAVAEALCTDGEMFRVLPYSTDLNAAFEAAERVGLFDGYQIGKWNPREYCVILSCDQPDEQDIIGRADTPALAICAAILKMKETNGTSTTRD